jgi:hypothetical protein
MGSDIADINNDGNLDIFTTEMLPEGDKRLKQITSFESFDVIKLKQNDGYYNQFMQNCLQLNNGDGTFSEIAFNAGVSATDWSWGALFLIWITMAGKIFLYPTAFIKTLPTRIT